MDKARLLTPEQLKDITAQNALPYAAQYAQLVQAQPGLGSQGSATLFEYQRQQVLTRQQTLAQQRYAAAARGFGGLLAGLGAA